MTRPGRFPLHAASAALALLLGATATDVLGVALDQTTLWIAGAYLASAGLLAGAIALAARVLAVPGLAGPVVRSRRFRRALPLALALILFALARWVRGDAAIPPDPAVLLAEVLGTALLLAGEWLHRRASRADARGRDPGRGSLRPEQGGIV